MSSLEVPLIDPASSTAVPPPSNLYYTPEEESQPPSPSNYNYQQQQDEVVAVPITTSATVSSIDSILNTQLREYIMERKKRKAKYEMCCVCCPNVVACDPRIPMVDLMNENVFFRGVVWALFARLYFEAIYLTRVYMLFSDAKMDEIIQQCDFRELVFGSSGAFR